MLLSRTTFWASTAAVMPGLTLDMAIVFGIIAAALLLFVTEVIPVDITAIGIMVALMLLEPWTGISPTDGISGFSNPATITVLAMFILSEGIRRTGLLQILGEKIAEITGGNVTKQLAAIIGLSGSTAGFINNTPVVAVMIPMVNHLCKKTRTSPSKLLMPLSFAAMMGGMLTLIGTSSNILASDVSGRLIGHPFSMFEFTSLGLLVLGFGGLYLLTIGQYLVPERIQPEEDLTEEFEVADYLTEVMVRYNSPLVGQTVRETLEELDLDVDIVQMIRNGEPFVEPLARKEFRPGDILIVRTDRDTLMKLITLEGLDPLPESDVTEEDLEQEETGFRLVELVVLPETPLIGETLRSLTFRQLFEASVLAIRRGGEFIHKRMDDIALRGGDTLLVQATQNAMERLENNRSLVVTQIHDQPSFRTSKIPHVLAILVGVVGLAALEVMPILVSALAGVIAMIVTDCLRPGEVYSSINWNVIFLLAGVIPLGMALERTGGASLLANLMVSQSHMLPHIVLLGLFYLVTVLVTQIISNNASIVLMIPVAVDAAQIIGAEPFSFVLAVTFASSTALLTPIGYQTNLMVYGPGGYRFGDFFRVGAGLQILLTLVTTLGIYFIWGV